MGAWIISMRYLVIIRLYYLFSVDLYGIVNNRRSILFRENSGEISQLENRKADCLLGAFDMDHSRIDLFCFDYGLSFI